MLAVENNAWADPPRFRVIRIQRLNSLELPPANSFDADVLTYGSMSINNFGEVVYGWKFGEDDPEPQPENDTMHPWVWLPENRYGFTAGFHDLFEVDVDDILALLNNWGICPAGEAEMFGGGGSELTAEDVLEFLESVGVPQETIETIEELLKN